MIFVLLLFVLSPANGIYDKYYLPNPDFERDWIPRYKPVPISDKGKRARAWTDFQYGRHIINMTLEIIKDCDLKMRHLEEMQGEYKLDAGFTLGEIAATVMVKYSFLVDLYKSFEVDDIWLKDEQSIMTGILGTYQTMLNVFIELKVEKNIYDAIVKLGKKNKDHHVRASNLRKRQKSILDRYRYQRGNGRRSPPHGDTDKAAEEEYKKSLRHLKWMEKWKSFSPDLEGIDVGDNLARVGSHNASNFLGFDTFQ